MMGVRSEWRRPHLRMEMAGRLRAEITEGVARGNWTRGNWTDLWRSGGAGVTVRRWTKRQGFGGAGGVLEALEALERRDNETELFAGRRAGAE